MKDKLLAMHHRLLNSTESIYHRYLFDTLELTTRMTGLIGARGTGKTTLMLQYIKERMPKPEKCIYTSLDSIYFTKMSLTEFVEDFYEIEGVRYFFLDEVHRYPGWNQELKNIYDAYPDIYIVFSGSSSLDLIKGTYDLSRRGVLYHLNGMSFREFLLFKKGIKFKPLNLKEILEGKSPEIKKITAYTAIRGLFLEYLESGYYPFLFEDELTYHSKLMNIIDKTVFEDISNFYRLKTENLPSFRKIIAYASTIPPGELNRNSISRNACLDNKTVQNYLNIMNETGLIKLITENKTGSNLLKETEKIYLDNPNLYKAVVDELGCEYNIGTVREIFFINMIQNSGSKIFYSKSGDFQVKDYIFEIGGKNKTSKQIQSIHENSYLVKDDITYPSKKEIPLYLFGFLY